MKPALSFCIPFYLNRGMLAEQYRVWASYPTPLKDRIEIVVVDDGSPDPAIDVARPAGLPTLRIYRVLEDRPWHQHGARNLAAHVAVGQALLMTDMDHILPASCLAQLLEHLDRDAVYTFHRLDAPHLVPKRDERGRLHPHPNTFCVRRDRYWMVGGYDEDCVGYGTDGFFRSKLQKASTVIHLDDVHVIRYPREVIPDASTTTLDRNSSRQTNKNLRMLAEKSERGVGPTTLNFEWVKVL